MIKSVLLITYLYFLLPLLIGLAVSWLLSQQTSFPFVFTRGYVCYLALFALITFICEHQNAPYERLINYWTRTIKILSIITLVCIVVSFLFVRKKHTHNRAPSPIKSKIKNSICFKSNIATAMMTLGLIILAVLFLTPHASDETPELARLTLGNNAFFSLDPSTGTNYAEDTIYPACIHLFYTFGSTTTGIDVTTIIHLLIPIFMIPLFICSYIVISSILFPDEQLINRRYHFVWLILLFYLIMLPLEAHIALTPYRNIWNGMTLASSCLIPLFFSLCFELTRKAVFKLSGISVKTVLTIPEFSLGLISLALSIRLCVRFSFTICGLFVSTSIVIIIVSAIKKALKKRHEVRLASSNPEGGVSS